MSAVPSTTTAATTTAAVILMADLSSPLSALIVEWLNDAGLATAEAGEAARADLLLVELPFPRQAAAARREACAARWPGVPVLALSPAFFPGVPSRGALARSLGVAAVLPTPVARDVLLATVFDLIGRGHRP